MKIPGYKIIKELGQGGMATVYLALHEMLEREVAIKVMAPSLGADPSFGERFLREAKIVAKLSHPNVIAVYDVGVSGTHHYIAMEYHKGGELKDKIGNGMEPKHAIEVISQIASALNFAHENGYIHRDVKPENILFSSDGKALLTDFGIARAEESSTKMTQAGSVIGTPTYMSPEQAQGKPLDGRADLYSLGVVFYEMLTGTPPYTGDSGVSIAVKHMTEPVPQFEGALKKYQSFLDSVMAKDPNDRVQSGKEFISLLKATEAGTAPAADQGKTQVWSPENKPGGTQVINVQEQHEAKKGGAGKIVAVLGVLLLAGGAGFYFMQQGDSGAPAPVAATSPEQTTGQDNTSDPLQEKIAALLQEAQVALDEKRIISPSGDNAFQKYQAVTFLDESNETARQGLLKISNSYLEKAQDSIAKNRLSAAEEQISQAREVFSDNPDVSRLTLLLSETRQNQQLARQVKNEELKKQQAKLDDQRIKADAEQKAEQKKLAEQRAKQREKQRLADDKKRAEQEKLRLARLKKQEEEATRKEQERQRRERQENIRNMVSKADDYLSPSNLSLSRINRAQKLFQDVKRLDSANSAVKSSGKKLADAYTTLAQQLMDDKDFVGAEEVILQGLEVLPGNDDLLAAQDSLKNRQKKKRRTFGGF